MVQAAGRQRRVHSRGYKAYATDAVWYKGFFDRLGIATRITETAGHGKAFQSLKTELEAGRPVVVWCSQARLPFLGLPTAIGDLWMHSFVVYGIDEAQGLAYGADRAGTSVTLTLEELAAARAGVCSHKNRTLTFDPAARIDRAALEKAIRAVLPLTATELANGKIKTFSLAGLETWAKMLLNANNKDGWLKVFTGRQLYQALRDVFESIEAMDAGGGLSRGLYADFLDEAYRVTGEPRLSAAAGAYRVLAEQWTALAEACLPNRVKPFKQAKELIRKQTQAFVQKGDKGLRIMEDAMAKRRAITASMTEFPLPEAETQELLTGLRDRIWRLMRQKWQRRGWSRGLVRASKAVPRPGGYPHPSGIRATSPPGLRRNRARNGSGECRIS